MHESKCNIYFTIGTSGSDPEETEGEEGNDECCKEVPERWVALLVSSLIITIGSCNSVTNYFQSAFKMASIRFLSCYECRSIISL